MPKVGDNQCRAKRADGTRCRAKAPPGRTTCMMHDPDPELQAKQKEGRKLGGVNRSTKAATLPADTPPLPLESVRDVVVAIGECYNAVRVGKIDVKVANAMFLGAGVLLRAIESGDLEQRIEALESNRPQQRRIGA